MQPANLAPIDQKPIDPKTDEIGAFCQHLPVCFQQGAADGPLAGLGFAAKDLYAVAGHRNGAGNPDWLESHPPASETALVVQQLLDAGATLVGKTHTDELAFSLNGENHWYGTPVNVASPGRIPGGSSNGSAAAVAAELCDFALGTDTGGSVRAPASFCKLFGMRTTIDLISVQGVLPLAPCFDTVGWFTRDLDTFDRISDVLLPPTPPQPFTGLTLLLNAFDHAEPGFLEQTRALAAAWSSKTGLPVDEVHRADFDLQAWAETMRLLQIDAIHHQHIDWLRTVNPTFGPGIAERFEWVKDHDPNSAEVTEAKQERATISAQINELFSDGHAILLPTVAAAAPLPSDKLTAMDDFRVRTMRLTSLSVMAGCPQFNLPLLTSQEGLPAGLSLMAPQTRDRDLVTLAQRVI